MPTPRIRSDRPLTGAERAQRARDRREAEARRREDALRAITRVRSAAEARRIARDALERPAPEDAP